MAPPLIDIDNVSFNYPAAENAGLATLNHLSLKIEEGEFVAIIGANGSGKTTLARHLNALLIPSSGHVHIGGLDTLDPTNYRTIRSQVGMVFQRPEDQFVATTVEEDIAFGPENMGLPAAEIRLRVETSLRAVEMWESRQRPPHMLSAGQMQRIALAGTLAMHPRCIIFDETTAMLDPRGRQKVHLILDRLHQEGMTIICITHFMEEAAQAQRIVVLHQGQVALQGTPDQVFSHPSDLTSLGLDLPPATALAAALHKRIPALPEGLTTLDQLVENLNKLPHHRPPGAMQPFTAPGNDSPIIIDVDQLSHIYLSGTPLQQQSLDRLSLQIHEGTTHGLIGATGSGKSSLLQHLNGLIRPQSGHVRVGDYNLNDLNIPLKTIIKQVGLVFQDPDMQIFNHFVGDEIAYGVRQTLPGENVRQRVQWAMEVVGLDFETYKDRSALLLSGGEKRKVALASTLALRPQILLLDEPTAGLDPLARRDLLASLHRFQEQGMTLVISSHHMDDIASLSQTVTALENGHQVLSDSTTTVFSQAEKLAQLGLEQPLTFRLASGLRQRGWDIPILFTHIDALAEALCQSLDQPCRGCVELTSSQGEDSSAA